MGDSLTLVAPAVFGFAAAPLLRSWITAFTGAPPGMLRLATVTASALAALAYGQARQPVLLALLLVLCLGGIVAAYVDAQRRLLPDVLTLPAYPLAGAVLIGLGVATGDGDTLLRSAAAAAIGLAGFAVLAATGGLGFGDVKLSGLLGLVLGWFSWTAAMWAMLAAFTVGGIHAAVLLAGRRADTTLPFGPAMLGGALIALAAA